MEGLDRLIGGLIGECNKVFAQNLLKLKPLRYDLRDWEVGWSKF